LDFKLAQSPVFLDGEESIIGDRYIWTLAMGANICGSFYGFDNWFMERIGFWAIALVGVFMFIDFLPPA